MDLHKVGGVDIIVASSSITKDGTDYYSGGFLDG